MEALLTVAAGGLVLGLAGSLHCACMCGGIATGALLMLDPATPRGRLTALLLLQTGRIATYAIAGGVAGGTVSFAIDPSLTAVSYKVLQWMAAAAIIWLGLSTAGLLPRLALPGLGSSAAHMILTPLRSNAWLGPVALGLSWGLTPCPMVYAALFSAALTGSAVSGALWMLAFGAGTLPGVISSALGVSALTRVRRSRYAETAAGLVIAAFGFSTFYLNAPAESVLCLTR